MSDQDPSTPDSSAQPPTPPQPPPVGPPQGPPAAQPPYQGQAQPPQWQPGPGQQYGGQPPSGYNAPPPGYYPPVNPPLSQSDEKLWGMLSFLLAIIAGFLAPLIIYFVYRERSAFVRAASREALNLQITSMIVSIGGGIAFLITGVIFGIAFPPIAAVMFVLWLVFYIAYAVFVLVLDIVGAMRANSYEVYEVPFILRLVKD